MELAHNQHRILIEHARQDAEFESTLHSLLGEIDRQRAMIRAMAYGSLGSAIIFFLFGLMVNSIFS